MEMNYIYDEKYHDKVTHEATRRFGNFIAIPKGNKSFQMTIWQNRNGNKDYRINFLASKGYLYITGDLGEAILHAEDFEDLDDWTGHSPDYFIEKIRCTSESPVFETKYFIKDFVSKADLVAIPENSKEMDLIKELASFCEDNPTCKLPEELWDNIENTFYVTAAKINDWLPCCGRRYPKRMIYWQTALSMMADVKSREHVK